MGAFDCVVQGTVATASEVLQDGCVAIRGETIAAIGQGEAPPAKRLLDYGEHLTLPGLVDGHMHTSSAIGWPGIEGATRSAVAGGVTTCVDMPYDVPHPVTDAAVLAEKVGWVERTSYVDMALYGTIRKHGSVEAIPGLAAAGVCAFKLSAYECDPVRFSRIDYATTAAAFSATAGTGLPVSVHDEHQELAERPTQEAKAAGQTHAIMHCRTRPPLAETLAGLSIFEVGLQTGAHVHIAHSSLARGFEIAEAFRGMGGQATGEACIQYLYMTEDDLVRLGGDGKCNPPFRLLEEVERMWQALLAGRIAYVSTDHASWPANRKGSPDIFARGAGLTGLQSFTPLMFTLLAECGLPPTLMAELCAERPTRFHGLWLRKGAFRTGADADLLILEPGDFTFDAANIQDRAELRWSPCQGRAMRARAAATLLRRQLAWDGTDVLGQPGDGVFLKRGM